MTELGNVIERAMESKGLSKSDLARISGVPQPTVSRIIAGITKQPTAKNLEALAKALDLRSGYLKRLAGLISRDDDIEPGQQPDEIESLVREIADAFEGLPPEDVQDILSAAAEMAALSERDRNTIITMIHTMAANQP